MITRRGERRRVAAPRGRPRDRLGADRPQLAVVVKSDGATYPDLLGPAYRGEGLVKVFVSYSRQDRSAVQSLVVDLVHARNEVWMDDHLAGGKSWWAEILEQIRACTVFVVALSDHSQQSKPCRAENDYAEALGLPIL